jgi:hypothetical protein
VAGQILTIEKQSVYVGRKPALAIAVESPEVGLCTGRVRGRQAEDLQRKARPNAQRKEKCQNINWC